MLGRKQGNTHFQEDRISRRIRAVEHHGVRPAKSRHDGVGQRPDEQCPHYLWQHELRRRRRHENEKEQNREDEKEYDRQFQRREHSRRRYGWRSAKKGRRYYARRYHEAAMTGIGPRRLR